MEMFNYLINFAGPIEINPIVVIGPIALMLTPLAILLLVIRHFVNNNGKNKDMKHIEEKIMLAISFTISITLIWIIFYGGYLFKFGTLHYFLIVTGLYSAFIILSLSEEIKPLKFNTKSFRNIFIVVGLLIATALSYDWSLIFN